MSNHYYNKPYKPGRGYFGICKFCGEGFYGRLNKLYHYECKVAFNNQKASKVNRSFNPLKAVILKNDKILRSNSFDSIDQNGVDKTSLIKQGIDFNVFTSIIKYRDLTYYRMNKFVYSINPTSGKINISHYISLKYKIKLSSIKR